MSDFREVQLSEPFPIRMCAAEDVSLYVCDDGTRVLCVGAGGIEPGQTLHMTAHQAEIALRALMSAGR